MMEMNYPSAASRGIPIYEKKNHTPLHAEEYQAQKPLRGRVRKNLKLGRGCPPPRFGMKRNTALIVALVFGIFFLAGCLTEEREDFKETPRFKSYSELKAVFEEQGSAGGYGRRFELNTMMGTVTKSAAADSDSTSSGGSAPPGDYSKTNVQVEGVDEADIVKTDGKYVYTITNNYDYTNGKQKSSLFIVDAYPAESAKIVSEKDLNGVNPSELFILGDKLLLFGQKYVQYPYREEEVSPGKTAEYDRARSYPYYMNSEFAVAQLYNIEDRAKIVLEKEIAFEGSYTTSRLIGENAYFVINSYPRYYPWVGQPCGMMNEESAGNCRGVAIAKDNNSAEDVDGGENSIIPIMIEDGVEKRIASATEIGYLPPMPARSFVTIASLNLETGEMNKETIAGNTDNVYASIDNIYLASTAWFREPVADAVGKVPVVGGIARAMIPSNEETVVNKFGLGNGKIGFVGQGRVPGSTLNQFSMDEYEGNFRIATTTGEVWNQEFKSKNNIYVLGKDMNTIGRLENLAPGEKIYSARFMGKKGYLVTFKKVDPLFVLDLSDAENPKVLGKLKIPGYSDYLHPIDENHIIGIGKDTIESGKGNFAWYQGMKLAIFDVSDVENPKEMHKIVIGDRGTDSYALHDHKAFLYDKEKELLVLPITLAEIPEEQKNTERREEWPAYGEPVFQGAFVFRLTLEKGFEERGRITHVSREEELKRGYYYGDDYSVKRALFIENALYTLSNKMLKANALDTLESIKEIKFLENTPERETSATTNLK